MRAQSLHFSYYVKSGRLELPPFDRWWFSWQMLRHNGWFWDSRFSLHTFVWLHWR